MYKYRIQIKKVSGRLNESVLPSKSLVVKSKTKKSKSAVLSEASKYFKKKYGLVIESAEIGCDEDIIFSLTDCAAGVIDSRGVDYDEQELFYIISDILEEYDDYPSSLDKRKCKKWVMKHLEEIESNL